MSIFTLIENSQNKEKYSKYPQELQENIVKDYFRRKIKSSKY